MSCPQLQKLKQEHFHQGQQGGYAILTNYHGLNHPQPPTPIQTDNLTAASVVNKTIKQKRSKAPMGVRF
jgi:hypothetical protein